MSTSRMDTLRSFLKEPLTKKALLALLLSAFALAGCGGSVQAALDCINGPTRLTTKVDGIPPETPYSYQFEKVGNNDGVIVAQNQNGEWSVSGPDVIGFGDTATSVIQKLPVGSTLSFPLRVNGEELEGSATVTKNEDGTFTVTLEEACVTTQ